MRARKFIFAMSILLVTSKILFATEEPKVSIHKKEGRTEAVVDSVESAQKQPEERSIRSPFSIVEKGIMGVASTSSTLVGKGTDGVIQGVQIASGFFLSPIFKALDFVKRSEAT